MIAAYNYLTELGVKVFYDKYFEADLWGKNLYTHLDDIYQNTSLYCIMFLSTNYRDKVWTNHERESAQARAFRQKEEYILPVRFDDTQIPGSTCTRQETQVQEPKYQQQDASIEGFA